jgi:hypothetical protein
MRAAIVAMFLLPAVAHAQAPGPNRAAVAPPRDQVAKASTAIIRGRITAADTGRALRWASVSLSGPGIVRARTVLTDDQGRYEFKDLTAGSFSLSVGKPGFVRLSYGQTRSFQSGRPLVLLDKQVLENVDFNLPRGGAITGRVYDELGDAAANMTVEAMRSRYADGRRRLTPSGQSAVTNDLGEFRIYGLQPGEYYVSVTMRFPGGDVETPGSGFAPSYYPGTTNPGEARRIAVDIGQTIANADVQLSPVTLATVSGVIVDAEGRSFSSASLNLLQNGPSYDRGVSFTEANGDGSFKFSGVPPGKYSIDVSPSGTSPGASGMRLFEPITVDGGDVAGLRVGPRPMSGARGRIVLDPANAAVNIRDLHISTAPVDPDEFRSFWADAKINPALEFDLPVLGGLMMLTADSLPAGWTLKDVRLEGTDVTDRGIEFKAGEKVAGIEVELTTRGPKVRGSVRDAKDKPLDDYTVLFFSQRKERWSDRRGRYFAAARPDQAGQFAVNTLPPGDYYAVALEYVDQDQAADPDFLDRFTGAATRVSLGEGEVRTVELKITAP